METLKKIGGISSAPSGSHIDSSSNNNNNNNNSTTLNRSEFNKRASRIGFGIHETSLKIGRLEKREHFYFIRVFIYVHVL